MDELQVLKKLGLNEHEASIYMALLRMGPSSVSDISKETGLHRPTIYKFIPDLLNRGLVVLSPKNKRQLYSAESPEKLKYVIDDLSMEFKMALPNLLETYSSKGHKPVVKYLVGKEQIKFIYEDLVRTLNRGEVFYRYSSTKDGKKDVTHIPKDYKKLRDEKKLERFVITSDEGSRYKKPKLERSTKVVPKQYGLFDYDVTQLIYADRLAIIDDNTETAFIIENKTIAEFQKKIFKIVFDSL